MVHGICFSFALKMSPACPTAGHVVTLCHPPDIRWEPLFEGRAGEQFPSPRPPSPALSPTDGLGRRLRRAMERGRAGGRVGSGTHAARLSDGLLRSLRRCCAASPGLGQGHPYPPWLLESGPGICASTSVHPGPLSLRFLDCPQADNRFFRSGSCGSPSILFQVVVVMIPIPQCHAA